MVYGVGYLWFCMGIMASSPVLYSGYIPLRTKGIACFYVLNFLISVSPMGFLTTWVYVKNNCSMLACIIFHLFVNTMQEKIALTPQTKCVETIVIFFVAAFIILTNKEMFFEREHIGYLLSYHEEREVDD